MIEFADTLTREIPPDRPVILAGPTASGKSALALAVAEAQGGTVVNADALQVWSAFRILTARPGPADLARAPHALYGHLAPGAPYSVGHWLAEVRALLEQGTRPILVGGTGLFLTALTTGLAPVPAVPSRVRTEATARIGASGAKSLLDELDAATRARIDPNNPARIQRAWEVLRATGKGLADWQAETPPPLLPETDATLIILEPDRALLGQRIDARFDAMLTEGALDEVRAVLPHWSPAQPWAKAIGARELVAHLRGEMSLDQASAAAKLASRQYAKRQFSWFRNRMSGWSRLRPA